MARPAIEKRAEKPRRRPVSLALGLCLLAWATLEAGAGAVEVGDRWQQDLRYEERTRVGELMSALDHPYPMRRKAVAELVSMAQGEASGLVREELMRGLGLDNPQIRQGAVEAMSRIGDEGLLSAITSALPYEPVLDVRVSMLRALPCFAVDEADRTRVVDLFEEEGYRVTEEMRALLRRRPFDARRGRGADTETLRRRRAVAHALADQLDPVGTAIQGLDDKNYASQARRIVARLWREDLPDRPAEVRAAWDRTRPEARLSDLAFVRAVQDLAARLIADLGVFETTDQLSELGMCERPQARTIALRTLAALAEFAHVRWAEDEEVLTGPWFGEADVLDYHGFMHALDPEAEGPPGPLDALLWERLPPVIRAQARAEYGKGEDSLKDAVLDALNDLLALPDLADRAPELVQAAGAQMQALVEQPAGGDELSRVRLAHLNRRLVEAAYPRFLHRHRVWRPVDDAQRSRRRQEQDDCRAAVQAAYELSRALAAEDGLDVSARRWVYAALGAARVPEAVGLLAEQALRAQTDADLRVEICHALGRIGGREAAGALGELAVYRGHAASLLGRQAEYRVVCAAYQALGDIVARPDDRGAREATRLLVRALDETRPPPDASLPGFAQQALRELRVALDRGEASTEPEEWLTWQAAYAARHAAQAPLRMPLASVAGR